MNRTAKTIASFSLAVLLVVAAGCSLAGDVTRAQVDVCGDLVVGILVGDGELIREAVPASVADEQPDLFAQITALMDESTEVGREWVDDELILTVPNSTEVYRLWVDTGADEPTVLGELAGEQTTFSVVETEDGWRVGSMDGMAVGELLAVLAGAPSSDEEMQAFNDQLDCYTNQLIMEMAAGVFADVEGRLPESMDELVPDWLDTVYFCPVAASQYSRENSEDGYFSGLGPDGVLDACSVHGHHTDAEE